MDIFLNSYIVIDELVNLIFKRMNEVKDYIDYINTHTILSHEIYN